MSAISSLIRTGAQLENDWGLETLFITCPESSTNCEMQTAGRFLLYVISTHAEEVHTAVALMDSVAAPQTLLRVRDDTSGWELITRFVGSLERYEVKSLERPIMIGPIGASDAFVVA